MEHSAATFPVPINGDMLWCSDLEWSIVTWVPEGRSHHSKSSSPRRKWQKLQATPSTGFSICEGFRGSLVARDADVHM